MKLTITGYSTALFSTWYFVEELGILLDAGDGVSSNLLGKTGKIRHAFITHADRDHLGGLLQFNQLFSKSKARVYYPKDAGSFKFLNEFVNRFDPQSKGPDWVPVNDGEEIKTANTIQVKAFENKHIDVPGQLKSLSYKIENIKQKLKPEFTGLSGNEIVKLKQIHGENYIQTVQTENILTYSGDTPVDDYSKYDGANILIHETTFLTKQEQQEKNHKNKHSALDEVMEMAANISINQLILGHFSTRYSTEEVKERIKKLKQYYNLKIPIFCLPIGEVARDILNGEAL